MLVLRGEGVEATGAIEKWLDLPIEQKIGHGVSGGTHGNQEQEIDAQQFGIRVSASPGSLEIQTTILVC